VVLRGNIFSAPACLRMVCSDQTPFFQTLLVPMLTSVSVFSDPREPPGRRGETSASPRAVVLSPFSRLAPLLSGVFGAVALFPDP